MALSKNMQVPVTITKKSSFGVISEENGFVNMPEAYIKVQRVNGAKDMVTADVTMTAGDISQMAHYKFAPNLDGANFIKQAYEHLKTLPEFSGATDC
jgi:hypothetical protein